MINLIGIGCIGDICSDSTSVTLNARHNINEDIPTIFDLHDPCHHLQNTIKDITKLPEFSAVCFYHVIMCLNHVSECVIAYEDIEGHHCLF